MTADPHFNRRLLNPAQLAEKLGYTRLNADLTAQLQRLGFPAPILGEGSGNNKTLRWDERAVDLWLDTRLPPDLREHAEKTGGRFKPLQIDVSSIERRLAQKAQEIHL